MRARSASIALFVVGSCIATNAYAQDGELCVTRLSVVEPGFITVLEGGGDTPGQSDGLDIEYADSSESKDYGIVEYGDQPVERAGVEVVRGDDDATAGELDITRGDEADESSLVIRGDRSNDGDGTIDLFRGDGLVQPTTEQGSHDSKTSFSFFGLDPSLVRFAPTANGFGFTFDNLAFEVMQTPPPENMAEAFAGLLPKAGKSHMRIETASTGCTPASFDARKGFLRLSTASGKKLGLTFPRAKRLKNASAKPGTFVYEFKGQMAMKADPGPTKSAAP